jgi:hypothetical protein
MLQCVSSVLALVLCFIAYKCGTMSAVMSKRKKEVDAENHQFQDNWKVEGGLLFYST